MRPSTPTLLGALLFGLSACASSEHSSQGLDSGARAAVLAAPPRAAVHPKRFEEHGTVRVDDYYWLRERESKEVLGYLHAENEYTAAVMAPTEVLQEELFEEIKGRIKQTDETVPYREGEHWYYTRYEEGREYPIHCRKRGSLEGPEEVLLDVNAMAEGAGYYSVRGRAVSPSGNLLAYAVDDVGRRIYTIHFKDLRTGEVLADVIPAVTGNLVWAEDDRTLFYTRQDLTTLRSHRIHRHALGSDPLADPLVYEETDDTFRCFVWKTKSRRFLVIGSSQTLATEMRYLPADDPTGEWQVFLPRERGHEYRLDHHGDHFYMVTNDGAENFRLMRTPITATGREHWEEVLPQRDDVLLEGIEVFREHLIVRERTGGLIRMRIRPWSEGGAGEHYLDFGEPAYTARLRSNVEYDSQVLRYAYSSLATPNSVYDYDLRTRAKTLRKQDEVLGGFDSENYRIERLHATAADGAHVPISMVYRVGTKQDGSNPLLLYGYGSYGASMDAGFRSSLISLLDRGFVYAIAHIRGGEELGRRWYEDGKLLEKKNTFTDFIACGEHLARQGWTSPDRMFAMGGSAGGLLVGAVINMRPDLFHGVVAAVPFVDVITTMLDESIPLTTGEYDEWGDPRDPRYYEYMLSYSPYDNVEAKAYPHLLVTTGLHDSQVQYWEPAKWVAKLRATKTDDNRLLLKTEMEAGHGGVSGRYRRFRDTAFTYAFLLDLAGADA